MAEMMSLCPSLLCLYISSWILYWSGDVLAHFKGVCAFLETVVQHTSRQKEETIYCPCKVCKDVVMFKNHEVIREHLV
jgi:hypothetical protein